MLKISFLLARIAENVKTTKNRVATLRVLKMLAIKSGNRKTTLHKLAKLHQKALRCFYNLCTELLSMKLKKSSPFIWLKFM